LTEHRIAFSPTITSRDYLDAFGNVCTRLVAPPGIFEIRNRFIIKDGGKQDEVAPDAPQWDIDQLPDDALVYLLASRYCDTEKLRDIAWSLCMRASPVSLTVASSPTAIGRSDPVVTLTPPHNLVLSMRGQNAPDLQRRIWIWWANRSQATNNSHFL